MSSVTMYCLFSPQMRLEDVGQNAASLMGGQFWITPLSVSGNGTGLGAVSLDNASGSELATPGMWFVMGSGAPCSASVRAISLIISLSGFALLLPFSMALRADRLSDFISIRVD